MMADSTIETAAGTFAVAVATTTQMRTPPGASLAPAEAAWCAANHALVELLLALAQNAAETWDVDQALYLLKAADAANGTVDPWFQGLPRRAFTVGPIERQLSERIVGVARYVIAYAEREPFYRDGMVRTSSEDFLDLIGWIEQRWVLATQEYADEAGA